MEFLYLFKALNRRKWIIIGSVLFALLAAFLLTMNEKKEYRSVAQIATGFTVTDEVSFTDRQRSMPQIEVAFNNVIENFNSTKVLTLLSYDLMLHDLTEEKPFRVLPEDKRKSPEYRNMPKEKAIALLTAKMSTMQPLNQNRQEDQQLLSFIRLHGYDVTSIKKGLEVARVPRTDYINIAYTSGNPELSAYAANTLITKFEDYYNQNRRQRSDTSIATLDSLVQQKRKVYEDKMAARSQFMAEKGIVDIGIATSTSMADESAIQTELTNEESRNTELRYRIGEFNRLIKESNSRNATASNANGGDAVTYLALKDQHRRLYNEWVQGGAKDADLKRRIDDVRNRMAQTQLSSGTAPTDRDQTAYVDGLVQQKIDAEAQLRASSQKIASLRAALGRARGGIANVASGAAGLDKYNNEVELAKAEYTKASERLNAALNITGIGGTSFSQTLAAQPSLYPEPTHRTLKIALAGISVFVLSCLVIILLEFIDQSIKTPSQFSKLTKLPLLGVVNHVKLSDANALQSVANINKNEKQRADTFRELLRKVRYEIENSGKKIFLFTSTEPQQGKTTLIQALAYSLSLIKKKVLIIDTNFCNNDLTVALSARPVLEKFYVNGKPFSLDDVKRLVTKTGVEGVDMIGCAGGNYTPREILPKNHLLNYLPELTKEYDYVFLEGAPLNDFTDTKELIHYSEGVVAVFSSEAALSAQDKESIRFFRQNEGKFLGAILNKVQLDHIDM